MFPALPNFDRSAIRLRVSCFPLIHLCQPVVPRHRTDEGSHAVVSAVWSMGLVREADFVGYVLRRESVPISGECPYEAFRFTFPVGRAKSSDLTGLRRDFTFAECTAMQLLQVITVRAFVKHCVPRLPASLGIRNTRRPAFHCHRGIRRFRHKSSRCSP